MVLVYTSLCGLIPKYANTAWDATLAMNTMSLKMLQKKTVKLGVGKVSLLMLWTEPATSQKKPKKKSQTRLFDENPTGRGAMLIANDDLWWDQQSPPKYEND